MKIEPACEYCLLGNRSIALQPYPSHFLLLFIGKPSQHHPEVAIIWCLLSAFMQNHVTSGHWKWPRFHGEAAFRIAVPCLDKVQIHNYIWSLCTWIIIKSQSYN